MFWRAITSFDYISSHLLGLSLHLMVSLRPPPSDKIASKQTADQGESACWLRNGWCLREWAWHDTQPPVQFCKWSIRSSSVSCPITSRLSTTLSKGLKPKPKIKTCIIFTILQRRLYKLTFTDTSRGKSLRTQTDWHCFPPQGPWCVLLPWWWPPAELAECIPWVSQWGRMGMWTPGQHL